MWFDVNVIANLETYILQWSRPIVGILTNLADFKCIILLGYINVLLAIHLKLFGDYFRNIFGYFCNKILISLCQLWNFTHKLFTLNFWRRHSTSQQIIYHSKISQNSETYQMPSKWQSLSNIFSYYLFLSFNFSFFHFLSRFLVY